VPRPPRVLVAGGIYHLTSRGNRRQEIFRDDVDRRYFLALLADVIARHEWKCHAYCLMTNHYHLLVETPKADLSVGMHRLNSLYAMWFNHRHGLDGHLFQGRFHSVLVLSTWHLIELSRYIVLNPVRAGLCVAAGAWRWSSYRAMIGRARRAAHLDPTWLLAQFGPTTRHAREAFRLFVAEGAARSPPRRSAA
jgi:REP element-mobilizing transposase RayT